MFVTTRSEDRVRKHLRLTCYFETFPLPVPQKQQFVHQSICVPAMKTELSRPNQTISMGTKRFFTNHISVNEDKGVIFPVPGFPLVKLNMNTCDLCPLLKSKPVELVKNSTYLH